jgi:hypothetical protein
VTVSKSDSVNLVLVLIISLIPILHSYDQNIYLSLVKEDGLVEYSTAIFLLLSSFIMILTLLKIKKNHLIFNFGVLLSAVALFFGFGEEISWGQRIFNIESSAFFNKNNLQGETNVHNLMIDGFKFNKWIFTYGLVLLFTFYFFVTPILYKKGFFPKTLINKFSFVVPNYVQSILFLFSTIIINVFDYNKVSELWECSFAVTIFFVCLFPLNKKGTNLFVNPLL